MSWRIAQPTRRLEIAKPVDSQRAKEILELYRPGSADDAEPDVQEALALARQDPELGRWLGDQVALHRAFQAKFRAIPVPPGLEQSILSTVPRPGKVIRWRQPVYLAAAAALVLLVGLTGLWVLSSRPEERFAGFRARMVRTALRQYSMDIDADSQDRIRQFLREKGAHADYELPPLLAKLPGEGGGVLSWQGNKVSMVCLDSQKKADLYVFVIARSALPDPPPPDRPNFAPVGRLKTASWSHQDKSYLLAAPDKPEFWQELEQAFSRSQAP